MSTRLIPLHDRVLVKPLPPQDMVGIFHVPESAKERPTIGTVLAVGPGRITETGALLPIPDGVEVGARVLYVKFSGAPADFDGEEVLLVKASDILGVVKPKLD